MRFLNKNDRVPFSFRYLPSHYYFPLTFAHIEIPDNLSRKGTLKSTKWISIVFFCKKVDSRRLKRLRFSSEEDYVKHIWEIRGKNVFGLVSGVCFTKVIYALSNVILQ